MDDILLVVVIMMAVIVVADFIAGVVARWFAEDE